MSVKKLPKYRLEIMQLFAKYCHQVCEPYVPHIPRSSFLLAQYVIEGSRVRINMGKDTVVICPFEGAWYVAEINGRVYSKIDTLLDQKICRKIEKKYNQSLEGIYDILDGRLLRVTFNIPYQTLSFITSKGKKVMLKNEVRL